MALNVRQQRFVEGVLAGKPASRAYQEAGYKATGHSAESAAERLLRKVEIAGLVRVANMKASENAELTAEWVINRLMDEARERGADASHSARIQALKLLGKRLGLFPDKVEHSGPGGKEFVVKVLGLASVDDL